MPPPLAPWLRGPDPEALSRGFRIGLAIRQARQQEQNAADALRMQQLQMESLNRWRQAQETARQDANAIRREALTQADINAQLGRESRESIASAANAIRERGVASLEGFRNRDKITKLEGGDLLVQHGDNTQEIIPVEQFGGEKRGPNPVMKPVPGHEGYFWSYNENNPTASVQLVRPGKDPTSLTPKQKAQFGLSLKKVYPDSKTADRIISTGFSELGFPLETNAPAATATSPGFQLKNILPWNWGSKSTNAPITAPPISTPSPQDYMPGTNAAGALTIPPYAPALPTPTVEPVPTDKKARSVGKVYQTSRGPYKWTGTGWIAAGELPAIQPVQREGLLAPIPELNAGPYDAMRGLGEPSDEEDEDEIDRLIQEMMDENAD